MMPMLGMADNSMNKIQLYPSSMLPPGFVYPKALAAMAELNNFPDIYPWWFIDGASDFGKGLYERRHRDGRNLIPFSKVDGDLDDIACFDGNDLSGDPAVLMLILDESNRNYSFQNFDAWLNFATEYSTNLREFLRKNNLY